MLINKDEMGALQLAAVYKDLPAKISLGRKVLPELLRQGYIRYNKSKTSFRVSAKGYTLLERAEIEISKDAHPVSDGRVLQRRHASAEIAMLFHEMQFDVIRSKPPAEIDIPIYISSGAMRRQFAANVLGMSKFSGILYTKNIAYIAYITDAPTKSFYPETDESMFRREIIRQNKDVKILFFGKGGYENLIKIVTAPQQKKKGVGCNYSYAMDAFSFPVNLIPLSDDGINQMRIMLTKNYKEIISRYLLGINYQSVNTEWVDAIQRDNKECFMVLIDFDLKRLERAMRFTRKLHVLVLAEQEEAFTEYLDSRPLGDMSFEVYRIPAVEVMRILNVPALIDLSTAPFITSKGGGINVEVTQKKKKRTRTNKG